MIPDPRSDGAWKVKTVSYQYAIERKRDRQEVISFHWEGEESDNPTPHLHVGFAAHDRVLPISEKAHIPSGRVAIEDIVKFAIEELGVQPIRAKRSVWRDIVSTMRNLFVKHKTW